MPEIIDTLTAFPSKSPFFTVTSEASAELQDPENPSPYLVNASGEHRFQEGDNFILLSAGIFIPYSFSPYVVTADEAVSTRLKLEIVDLDGNIYPITELGTGSKIHIPLENYETGLGIFVPVLTKRRKTTLELLTGKFYLKYTIEGLVVSLIGAPSNFVGLDIPVFPYVKILHNLPLDSATPPQGALIADFTFEVVEEG